MPSYPGYRPPAQSNSGGSVLDIILRRGDYAADLARSNGAIWGNALAGAGQILAGGIQQHAEEQQTKKRTAALDAVFNGPEPPTLGQLIGILGPRDGTDVWKGTQAIHPDAAKQYGDRMSQFRDVARGIKALPEERRAAAYQVAVNGLVNGGVAKPGEVPEYSPDVIEMYANYGKEEAKPQALQGFAPGTTVVDPATRQPVLTIPAAPKEKAAPAVGTFEDYVVRRFGSNPTPVQITAARKDYQQADDRPLRVTTGDDEKRGRLVDAVIANPGLWDDLTPSDKGSIAADLNKRGFTGFGKALTDGAVKQLTESRSAIASLNDLRETLKENEQYLGPVAGMSALNPYSDARKAQAKIDLVKQRVGKALEGGVLRKEDEEKYKKILSTLTDTPETAIYKVDNLIATLQRDLEAFQTEQRLAGRRAPQGGGSPAPSGSSGGAPVRVSSPAEAARLPKGTMFQTPDGRIMLVP